MAIVHVNKNNFQAEVMESDKKVLVDFWASWCAPCRMVAPVLDELAQERPDIKVVKINVDEEMELASQFRIISIPTMLVMEGGRVINQISGARPKHAIAALL